MTSINLNNELVILEVAGEDASTYLQGQLTNDIFALQQNRYQFSAHLNNKGRIIASFIITKVGDNHYLLITAKALAQKIAPRLKMFILRSKVTLSISEQNIYLSDNAIAGYHSFELANKAVINIGSQALESIEDSQAWHRLLVTNGIPMIYLESSEKIIPQQVNYDLIGGVNFKKGCYTGQEIVARTHYLGKIKRRMARFSSTAKPLIGQTVVSPILDNQEVGFIVDYYQEDQQYLGLVSLQKDCINNAYLDSENKNQLNCTNIIEE